MAFKTIERETVLNGVQTSGAASTEVNHGVITEVNGVALEDFESLLLQLNISVGSTGGAWELYVQIPCVENPVSATDAHWQDWFHFGSSGAGTISGQHVAQPYVPVVSGVSLASDVARVRDETTLGADNGIALPFVPDQLRVISATGVGVTVAATFSLVITGKRPWAR